MPKPSVTLPLASASAFEERLELARKCCQHAGEAGTGGRPGAAHGLFQTALLFFDLAQTHALPGDEAKLYLLREEIEQGALLVYAPRLDATPRYALAHTRLRGHRQQTKRGN